MSMRSPARAILSTLVGIAIVPLPSQGQGKKDMSSEKTELKQLILLERKEEAGKLAHSMGSAAGEVFLESSLSNKGSVRLLVLELAAANPSIGSCRTVLGRLSDSNATIRSLAASLIPQCCQNRGTAPDLLRALQESPEPATRSAIVAQLGIAGGPEQVPLLRKLLSDGDTDVTHAASLALVRLGDTVERQKLIRRLQDRDPQVRTNALRDCMTVRDPKLAAWFGPALDDVRDVVPISGMHAEVPVYARVCDYAVMIVAQLGYRFSFSVEFLERRSPEQIREAKQIVDSLSQERNSQ
jgi:hypothetical protein